MARGASGAGFPWQAAVRSCYVICTHNTAAAGAADLAGGSTLEYRSTSNTALELLGMASGL